MFEPSQTFKKNLYFFCFLTSKFTLFYTLIEEKRDKFFLRSTAIIIFPHRLDTVFCFYCAAQRKKRTLDSERNIEVANTTFLWKKAPQCFEEHQQTHCQKSGVSNLPMELHFEGLQMQKWKMPTDSVQRADEKKRVILSSYHVYSQSFGHKMSKMVCFFCFLLMTAKTQ